VKLPYNVGWGTVDQADYPGGFFVWLTSETGHAVWVQFEWQALQMAGRRKRYSARTIVESIRWNMDLKTDGEFKICNNWIPGMARLWMAKHGRATPGFFNIRDSRGFDEPAIRRAI
jgi:hypothetical protein